MSRPIIKSLFPAEVITAPAKEKIQVNNRYALAEKRMTLPQHRVLMGLLALPQTDKNFGRFKVSLKGLMHLAGFSTWRNKRAVLDVIRNVGDGASLVIPDFEEGPDGKIGIAVVWPIRYAFWDEQEEVVYFELNEKLKELLLNLRNENFTLIGIEEFKRLQSARAAQLFILASFCRKLNESRCTFEVDWLKVYLRTPEESSWNDTWMLMQRAAKVVREHTSFNVVLTPRKRGFDKRKVTHITLGFRDVLDAPKLGEDFEQKQKAALKKKKEKQDKDQRVFMRKLYGKGGEVAPDTFQVDT